MKLSICLPLGFIPFVKPLPIIEQNDLSQAQLKDDTATNQASHFIQLSPTTTKWVTEKELRDLEIVCGLL
jgi:hypothetical protein